MELIVVAGGREEHVHVEEISAGRFVVRVGEWAYEIDAAEAGAASHSLLIDGRQYEVMVTGGRAGRYRVSNGGNQSEVSVSDPLTYKARVEGRVAGAAGRRRVTAYMPGRVVAVLVEAGSRVAAGAGLVVLEAMKMENEIQAEVDCVIHQILVAPQQAVEAGDPLFEIE